MRREHVSTDLCIREKIFATEGFSFVCSDTVKFNQEHITG